MVSTTKPGICSSPNCSCDERDGSAHSSVRARACACILAPSPPARQARLIFRCQSVRLGSRWPPSGRRCAAAATRFIAPQHGLLRRNTIHCAACPARAVRCCAAPPTLVTNNRNRSISMTSGQRIGGPQYGVWYRRYGRPAARVMKDTELEKL